MPTQLLVAFGQPRPSGFGVDKDRHKHAGQLHRLGGLGQVAVVDLAVTGGVAQDRDRAGEQYLVLDMEQGQTSPFAGTLSDSGCGPLSEPFTGAAHHPLIRLALLPARCPRPS
jgi:hypothetical protein